MAGVDDQWQADLVDMQPLARENGGVKYLLTCIDVFSKYAWVLPLHDKSAGSLVAAFRDLLGRAAPRRPHRLQTDKGREFLNASLQQLLAGGEGGPPVEHFTTWSDMKAAVVERFNRTLKARMWQYFTEHQTHHYMGILPRLVEAYNKSPHRSIGTSPVSVQPGAKALIEKVRTRLYGKRKGKGHGGGGGGGGSGAGEHAEHVRPHPARDTRACPPPPPPPPPAPAEDEAEELDPPNRPAVLEPGAKVRISRVKGVFEKGYAPNWSAEDFRIREIVEPSDVGGAERTTYKLEDRSGEPISGSWYQEELLPISRNRYLIEHILRRRPIKGRHDIVAKDKIMKTSKLDRIGTANDRENTGHQREEVLVKWLGWPDKYNTWIPDGDLVRFQQPTDDR